MWPDWAYKQEVSLPHLTMGHATMRSLLGLLFQCPCDAHRSDSRFAPSQWETSLQSNGVSDWLSTNLESALCTPSQISLRAHSPGFPFKPGGPESPLSPGTPPKPGWPLSPLRPGRPGSPGLPESPLEPAGPLGPGGPETNIFDTFFISFPWPSPYKILFILPVMKDHLSSQTNWLNS